jgi:hypothetical protein
MIRGDQQSFLNYLSLIRVSEKTKEAYLRSVTNLAAYYNLSAADPEKVFQGLPRPQ